MALIDESLVFLVFRLTETGTPSGENVYSRSQLSPDQSFFEFLLLL